MKNKIWVFVVAFFAIGLCKTEQLSGQITSGAQEKYVPLSSYKGVRINSAYTFTVHIPQQNSIESGWSLKVSVLSSSNGMKDFPVNEISLELNSIVGTNNPNISEVGVIGGEHPLSKGDVLFIENSSVKKDKGFPYAQWNFLFDLKIAGGGYLEEYKTWSEYTLVTKFSLYNGGVMIAEKSWPLRMQIYPTDTPPSGPEFGFEVNANATLNFNTPEQYTRQVENDPNNSWINVTSKKSGYVINVKTNNVNFDLIRNDSGVSGDATIPVNVVNVEVQSAGSGTSQGAKALSSTAAQTLFIGTKNNNLQKLPVRYFITKTEAEKLATKTSGEYKAILTYTLEPN